MSIVHRELADGIIQLSSDNFPLSIEPGSASRNAYMVIGDSGALLFDLSLEESGLFEYAAGLAGLPLWLVLSHAHVDHIYHLSRKKEVWMHSGDEKLLRKGCFFQKPVKHCPELHFLHAGEQLDLGNRKLTVFHIPGHTPGSILLWDVQTGILFSGDTVARRLLYGLHGFIPFDQFCASLGKLQKLPISRILSAHDRCPLPPEHIAFMIRNLSPETLSHVKRISIPFVGQYLHYSTGTETELQYFDLAAWISKR